jgi:hypothetical protein
MPPNKRNPENRRKTDPFIEAIGKLTGAVEAMRSDISDLREAMATIKEKQLKADEHDLVLYGPNHDDGLVTTVSEDHKTTETLDTIVRGEKGDGGLVKDNQDHAGKLRMVFGVFAGAWLLLSGIIVGLAVYYGPIVVRIAGELAKPK